MQIKYTITIVWMTLALIGSIQGQLNTSLNLISFREGEVNPRIEWSPNVSTKGKLALVLGITYGETNHDITKSDIIGLRVLGVTPEVRFYLSKKKRYVKCQAGNFMWNAPLKNQGAYLGICGMYQQYSFEDGPLNLSAPNEQLVGIYGYGAGGIAGYKFLAIDGLMSIDLGIVSGYRITEIQGKTNLINQVPTSLKPGLFFSPSLSIGINII